MGRRVRRRRPGSEPPDGDPGLAGGVAACLPSRPAAPGGPRRLRQHPSRPLIVTSGSGATIGQWAQDQAVGLAQGPGRPAVQGRERARVPLRTPAAGHGSAPTAAVRDVAGHGAAVRPSLPLLHHQHRRWRGELARNADCLILQSHTEAVQAMPPQRPDGRCRATPAVGAQPDGQFRASAVGFPEILPCKS